LKRVLINLMTNAVKFSEAGTCVTIHCEVTAQDDLTIAVEDHGVGMAPEEIPIALIPFQQIDNGLQRKYQGTGLGLPIAKQLVEMHGGRLTIESALGRGTTVTILLPSSRLSHSSDVEAAPPLGPDDRGPEQGVEKIEPRRFFVLTDAMRDSPT
jgi:signal transduction histidine kinase